MIDEEMPGLRDPDEAARVAQAFLDDEGDGGRVVRETMIPNPLQGLWIVSYTPETEASALVVTNDEVRYMSSDPLADEYVGALMPEVDEDPAWDGGEAEQVLALFGPDLEAEALLQQFGFDPSQPRAEDGKWEPPGGDKGAPGPKAEEDKPTPEWKRKANLVRAILKALDDVMDQLTSKQAKALVERIKDNADAFIEGQSRTAPAGGGKSGGGKKGGTTPAGGGGKGGSSKKGGTTPAGGGKGGGGKGPGGLEGVIAGVKSLIENFGRGMKPESRKALSDAVSKLDSMAAMTFAPGDDFSETVCIMAIPAADDPVHGIGPEDKHATLLYFGDRSKSADPERIEGSKGLFLNVLAIAAGEQEPFTAKVKGVESLGDEGAQVWMLDSPELQRLFEDIPDIDSEIRSMYEDADATRYPEYLPHVTIGYAPEGPDGHVTDETLDAAKAVKEIRFDRLSLWWGNEHVDVPLGVAEFDALIEQFGG